MTEATVRVAVGPYGIDHTGGIGTVEQHGGEPAFDQSTLTIEEGSAGGESVVAHTPQCGMSDAGGL